MIRQSTVERYVGKRYGRFIILRFLRKGKRNTEYFYECRCDCGIVKAVRLGALQQGTTTSCGCAKMEQIKERNLGNTFRRLSEGEGALNMLFGHYKRDASRRGRIAFSLSRDEFKELTSRECFYCGAAPSQKAGLKTNFGKYIYSGIDRVDNALGYTTGNCVPCCKSCNSAKNGVTKDMVQKIYHFLFKKS